MSGGGDSTAVAKRLPYQRNWRMIRIIFVISGVVIWKPGL